MTENALNLSSAARPEIPYPSKWDIIPIHTSDRATFKDCRRKWDWSSPTRTNLSRKIRVYGITWPLFFGTAIHYALERYYDPILREDPVVAFQSYMDMHWQGGIVTASDIKKYGLEDREPEVRADGSYTVVGLDVLLPNADPSEWAEYVDLGTGMLNFYKGYAQKEDNFTTIAVEHEFSVPILSEYTGQVLYMPDHRLISPEWDGWVYLNEDIIPENKYGPLYMIADRSFDDDGKLVVLKQVHARGRMDKIVQDNYTGQYGIHDYKTASRVDDDYFRHLELDDQVTTYMWAAEREAEMYGLEYSSLDFIVYEALLKGYPKPPTPLKDGITPSIARTTETTTAELFEKYIADHGLQAIYAMDAKWQAYYTWLLEIGDKRFIDRKRVERNKAQKANAGRRIYLEAVDMLSNPSIYPNPRKDFLCLNCNFRVPCILAENGGDYVSVLSDAYQINYDR